MASVGPSMVRSPRLDAVEVHDRNDAAHDGRELDEADLVELGRLQRHVGRAEGDGAGGDLLDAAAGADRLIVQAVAGLLLVGVGPFGVDRIGEGRAGAGNVGGVGRGMQRERREAGRGQCGPMFHGSLHVCGQDARGPGRPTRRLYVPPNPRAAAVAVKTHSSALRTGFLVCVRSSRSEVAGQP